MKIRIVDGQPAMATLQPHWQQLAQDTQASVFMHYAWCEHQAQLCDNPVLVTAWEGETCVGILPLAVRQLSAKASVPVLTHLCQRFTDYQGMLIAATYDGQIMLDAMVAALARSVFKGHSLFIPFADAQLAKLLSHLPGIKCCQHWQHTRFDRRGPAIKGKLGREARRRERKLAEQGELNVQIGQAFDPEVVHWVLDTAAQRHGPNALTDPARRNTVLALLEQCGPSLHLSWIKQNGEFLAAHMGFCHGHTLYYYVPVTSDRQRQASPGIILLNHIMAGLEQAGLTTIDFLRGEEDYKQDWGNVHEQQHAWLLPAKFGLNIKRRVMTAVWLRRNP